MYTLLLCLCLAQTESKDGAGAAFFKVVNGSDKTIIVHIADTDEKFSQVITLQAGGHQWVAVKQGNYKCGLANKEMKTCGINAGQIIQIDLPWKTEKEKTTETTDVRKEKDKVVSDEKPPPKKEPPPLPVAKEPEKKEPEKKIVKEPEKKEPEKKEPEKKEVVKEPEKKEPPKEPTIGKNQALVEINNMPEDGRIWFDNQEMKDLKQRWVKTPDKLDPGQRYFYQVRAEVTRGRSNSWRQHLR